MICVAAILVTALTPSCDVVRDFGAAGDNRTEDTAAVAAALAACSLVRLPPKHVFLLRPIETSPVTKQPLDRYQGGPRRIVAYPVFPLGSSRGVVDAPRRPPTPDASDDDDDDDDDDEPVMPTDEES